MNQAACSWVLGLLMAAASRPVVAQGVAEIRPWRSVPPRGLAFGVQAVGNINFSVQAFPAVGARFQKNSYAFPSAELVGSYTWPRGWRVEGGLGVGSVAAVTIDAREQFGQAATASFGTIQIPLRLYRHVVLGDKKRYSISPLVGLQVVAVSAGEKDSGPQPIFPGKPAYGSQRKWFRSGQGNLLTYQAGMAVNYFASAFELNVFARYTNSFGNPTAAEGYWEYDVQGVQQPSLHTTSRLENVAVGIGIRRTFYSR